MSRKQVFCILLAVLSALCLAACSGTSDAEASSEADADGSETGYMSWTASEWDAASADEKYSAAADVIRADTEPQMSLESFVEQAKDDPALDAQVLEVQEQIQAGFDSAGDDATLQDVADAVYPPA